MRARSGSPTPRSRAMRGAAAGRGRRVATAAPATTGAQGCGGSRGGCGRPGESEHGGGASVLLTPGTLESPPSQISRQTATAERLGNVSGYRGFRPRRRASIPVTIGPVGDRRADHGAASCGFSRPASRRRRRCPCARPSGLRGSRPGAVIGRDKPASSGDRRQHQAAKRPRSFWLKFTIPGRMPGRSVAGTPIHIASVAASWSTEVVGSRRPWPTSSGPFTLTEGNWP